MLKGKVIVITGGAGLIGKAFAGAIVSQGGIAIIADVDEIAGDLAKQEIGTKHSTSNVDFVRMDINCRNSILQTIHTLNDQYGAIDAVVNNAYPRNENYGRHFFDVQPEDFCENISLNLGGVFLVCQQFAAFFKGQGFGNIVNVASIYGVMAPRFEVYANTPMTMPVEYAAIKSAVVHLTKYLAKYLKGLNIRVNAISPGGILDGQSISFIEAYARQCMNKGMLDKSDICGALIFLLADLSLYVNGQNIVVDDGFSL